MTCNQDKEAAAFSAAIQRHRSASAGPASKRLYRLRNGAFSSTLAEITDFRVRNAGRRWLAIGIQQAQRDAASARHHRKAKEASACEARLADLHAFALALGPMEPETLILQPEWRVQ